MRRKRQAQSEYKRKVVQDLFSSWPQLWCCSTQRVSPQHCSVAPVWDIAWGSPPALGVRWMSMTSPRTTDKLLHPHQKPPSSQLPQPRPGQIEQCLGPVYQLDSEELNKVPRRKCPSFMKYILFVGLNCGKRVGMCQKDAIRGILTFSYESKPSSKLLLKETSIHMCVTIETKQNYQ